MYCTRCGAQNEDNSRFCEACGTPFEVVRATRRGVRPSTWFALFTYSFLAIAVTCGFHFLLFGLNGFVLYTSYDIILILLTGLGTYFGIRTFLFIRTKDLRVLKHAEICAAITLAGFFIMMLFDIEAILFVIMFLESVVLIEAYLRYSKYAREYFVWDAYMRQSYLTKWGIFPL